MLKAKHKIHSEKSDHAPLRDESTTMVTVLWDWHFCHERVQSVSIYGGGHPCHSTALSLDKCQ